MKIDIIIPTFNRSQWISRAVDSVLNQSYQDFSLYVIDDGSTDETQKILEVYASNPKITLIKQSNKGVSAARNLGVRNSHNEWISFLDSDDEWLPHKLAAQIEYLNRHPQINFLHAEEIWMRNGVRVNPKIKHSKSGPDLFKRSLEFCLISPSTVILKRDLFTSLGMFDENFLVCEDFDLWNKILSTQEVGFLDDYVTKKYGGHADQLSTQYVAMDYWRIKSLVNLYQNSSDEIRPLIEAEVAKKTPVLLKGYLKHGNVDRYQELLELTGFLALKL